MCRLDLDHRFSRMPSPSSSGPIISDSLHIHVSASSRLRFMNLEDPRSLSGEWLQNLSSRAAFLLSIRLQFVFPLSSSPYQTKPFSPPPFHAHQPFTRRSFALYAFAFLAFGLFCFAAPVPAGTSTDVTAPCVEDLAKDTESLDPIVLHVCLHSLVLRYVVTCADPMH